MGLSTGIAGEWLAQRGHLVPWVPVCLAAGIGAYFSLRFELLGPHFIWVGMTGLACLLLAWLLPYAWRPLALGAALMCAGLLLAGSRAHGLAEPVLGWRYYGPVEGRIVGMDRSSSGALRLTLDQVRLRDVSPARSPARVRISLHGDQYVTPEPGLRVMTTAHLSPPGGPVEPGGFDFQRHAWFLQIGAWGYTRNPVLIRAPPDGTQALFAARMALSTHVQRTVPGEPGAFAAAVMAGDRSGISQDTLKDLRVSNLAHLLAISGLHMGLLVGFVFAALRYGFALIPALALRWPVKKFAAVIALGVAAGYLGLSGGNIATERAFIMVAVALVAVLLDRQVFSLRAVAVAAVIVLCLRPEALLSPGFQMSFSATTALVAAFGWLRGANIRRGPRWVRPILAVALSSFVAGLATAPIAAAHFNQIAHYGLIANLLSVPLMGLLVMPAAVIAACLMPFGLDQPVLWIMGKGVAWILGVADWVAGLDGARGVVVSPAPHVLPLLALGLLIIILWNGRARMIGLAPALLAFWIWAGTDRPDVLIAENGSIVGVMTDQGRALNREKGSGFVALNWLENDGDANEQASAAQLWDARSEETIPIIALRGKKAAATLQDCAAGSWVVLNVDPPEEAQLDLACTVLYPEKLRQTGALALYLEEGKVTTITARQITGTRLWNTQ